MHARLHDVAVALPNTCRWLQSSRQFLAWIDEGQIQEHHGILWIKGKPESGMSTVMKAAVARVERVWRAHIILTYFFNARSPGPLEKSSLGLYRSLLHQLLTAYPNGQALSVNRFASKERDGMVVDAWTEQELQNFLTDLIAAQKHSPVTVFIDALDEGRTEDVRLMVSYLDDLTQHSSLTGAVTRVCLSSRHFPHISIRQSLSIVLEDQAEHRRDIEIYIRQKLVGNNSLHMWALRGKVHRRAAGTFLWVVMVITMLHELDDQGKKPVAMLRKLNEVPQDLHDMFLSTLTRNVEDIDECIALLRWVLYSLRPLEPVELYVAVQQAYASEGNDDDEDDHEALRDDRVARYLVNCSRGLVEFVVICTCRTIHSRNRMRLSVESERV